MSSPFQSDRPSLAPSKNRGAEGPLSNTDRPSLAPSSEFAPPITRNPNTSLAQLAFPDREVPLQGSPTERLLKTISVKTLPEHVAKITPRSIPDEKLAAGDMFIVVVRKNPSADPKIEPTPESRADENKTQLATLRVLARMRINETIGTLRVDGMDEKTASAMQDSLDFVINNRAKAAKLEGLSRTQTLADTRLAELDMQRRYAEPRTELQIKALEAISWLADYQAKRENLARDPVLNAALGNGGRIGPASNPAATSPEEQDAFLVESIVKGNAPVTTVILPTTRKLQPSIDAWNAANPERKIHLIEVTPEGVSQP